MVYVGYDWFDFVSFPSSFKVVNDIELHQYIWITPELPIRKGEEVSIELKIKQRNVLAGATAVRLFIWDGEEWKRILPEPWSAQMVRRGNFDWADISEVNESLTTPVWTIPEGAKVFKLQLVAGKYSTDRAECKENPSEIKLDDLKIYRNGVLIYEADFTNWNPYIGLGLGAVLTGILTQLVTGRLEYSIGVGLLGGLGGGAVGYYLSGWHE